MPQQEETQGMTEVMPFLLPETPGCGSGQEKDGF